MKKLIKISCLPLFLFAWSSHAQPEASADQAPETTAEQTSDQLRADLGYYFGYTFGNMLRDGGAEDVDVQRLVEGLQDSLSRVPPDLDPARREIIFEEIRRRQLEAQEQQRVAQEQYEREVGASNIAAAAAFLEENAAKEGVISLPSGLQYMVLQDADGPNAAADSTVVVNYEGRLLSGEVFDQTGGTPVEFELRMALEGWIEGLQLMSAGDKFRFFIPSELAYGAGSVGKIPPNSLLIFEIELVEIK